MLLNVATSTMHPKSEHTPIYIHIALSPFIDWDLLEMLSCPHDLVALHKVH